MPTAHMFAVGGSLGATRKPCLLSRVLPEYFQLVNSLASLAMTSLRQFLCGLLSKRPVHFAVDFVINPREAVERRGQLFELFELEQQVELSQQQYLGTRAQVGSTQAARESLTMLSLLAMSGQAKFFVVSSHRIC